jgi:hypothetical protein
MKSSSDKCSCWKKNCENLFYDIERTIEIMYNLMKFGGMRKQERIIRK